MHHIQRVQFQVGEGVAHRRRDKRRGRSLDFKSTALAAADDQEIQFRPALRGPEETFFRFGPQVDDQLLDNETFP